MRDLNAIYCCIEKLASGRYLIEQAKLDMVVDVLNRGRKGSANAQLVHRALTHPKHPSHEDSTIVYSSSGSTVVLSAWRDA